MFKTFTASTLAAVTLAKGLNDGTTRENAVSTVLMSTSASTGGFKLTLHSYNSDNSGTLEFHGDLVLET